MRDYLRLFRHAMRHTFDYAGRAPRVEVFACIVLSQGAFLLVAWPMAWFAPDPVPEPVEAWGRYIIQLALALPALSLMVRRLHDLGLSGRWGLILLIIAMRTFALDLLALLAGWQARSVTESVLAYADWLLFLPSFVLYIALLAIPGRKGPNRYGPDPRDDKVHDTETAGSGNPEPAV